MPRAGSRVSGIPIASSIAAFDHCDDGSFSGWRLASLRVSEPPCTTEFHVASHSGVSEAFSNPLATVVLVRHGQARFAKCIERYVLRRIYILEETTSDARFRWSAVGPLEELYFQTFY